MDHDISSSINEDEHLHIGAPKTTAAGVTAVAVSLRHALGEMGVRRSAKTLLKLNQPDGFDCPGAHGRNLITPVGRSSVKTGPRQWRKKPPPNG